MNILLEHLPANRIITTYPNDSFGRDIELRVVANVLAERALLMRPLLFPCPITGVADFARAVFPCRQHICSKRPVLRDDEAGVGDAQVVTVGADGLAVVDFFSVPG